MEEKLQFEADAPPSPSPAVLVCNDAEFELPVCSETNNELKVLIPEPQSRSTPRKLARADSTCSNSSNTTPGKNSAPSTAKPFPQPTEFGRSQPWWIDPQTAQSPSRVKASAHLGQFVEMAVIYSFLGLGACLLFNFIHFLVFLGGTVVLLVIWLCFRRTSDREFISNKLMSWGGTSREQRSWDFVR